MDAALGQHGMDLRVQPRPCRDELGAMADQFPHLPGGRWSDPRLGQPAHAQQISKIRRVTFVVLDPPVGEALHPERMRPVSICIGGAR